jgi:hypothetical protein
VSANNKIVWACAACGVDLEPAKVQIEYRGSAFPVELLQCSQCGIVFIPEELAQGRMAEAEKMLEDK